MKTILTGKIRPVWVHKYSFLFCKTFFFLKIFLGCLEIETLITGCGVTVTSLFGLCPSYIMLKNKQGMEITTYLIADGTPLS